VREQDEKFAIEDSILILICVEEKDKEKSPIETAEKIKELIGETKTPLVIIPFIHLTTTPATPKIAYMRIKEVVSRLEKDQYETSLLQFGWHRSLRIHTIAGQNAFEYLET
jgi:hypothetical protein